jgi:cyclin-dependent kinase 9
MVIVVYTSIYREVFKARCKKTKKLVALKKVLMENEKEGVSVL